ncbi:hypothetical protein CCACVL1_05781 [Corchorus capsularis]|uniref:Uncharacterized protein n=1 Tax=Corchorus capsularis TaxID=210143 RepID=A0A1R3JJ46_COCAP|nr:hypothetical protein CCACVL1_05781 [Corchorus capsularis]
MATLEESSTLEFIRQHLLGDFASADAFLTSLDFGLSQLHHQPDNLIPELELDSPVSDPSYQIPDFFSFEVKTEVMDLESPTNSITSAGEAAPPATTGRKRRRETRIGLPAGSDVTSPESAELAWEVKEEEGEVDDVDQKSEASALSSKRVMVTC